ncbi:choice-of-anchor M domain-containing protein [Actinoplanes sp. DH11]|uniref:choice-of-anchor M domain-containing protein n=1 Tax=Actinoplanes sp. DH11 TaxID=2857011 RepID=UPI001E5B393B|nr:choice-of-anchor M domain-containing protein [Actinoplanes sp. DH11]
MKRLLTAAALSAALVVAAGSPAYAATTLTSGHVDVLDVDYTAPGTLTLNVGDQTGGTLMERDPADVVFQVPAAAKITVPAGTAWSFLGTTGGTAWVLPQGNTSGLLWPGWNTADIPSGVFQANSVTFRLNSFTGPGHVSVYTVASGTPTRLFDSSDGLPDTRAVAYHAHTHANWAFTKAGTYTVNYEVTGKLLATGATVTTGTRAFTFTVLP